ncbi:MAG: DUF1918 domain-containing protein [Mycobacteriales bacterium]
MKAQVGDLVVVHGRKVGDAERRGEVVEVRGRDGAPPYVVHWETAERDGLFFPSSDVTVHHPAGH